MTVTSDNNYGNVGLACKCEEIVSNAEAEARCTIYLNIERANAGKSLVSIS